MRRSISLIISSSPGMFPRIASSSDCRFRFDCHKHRRSHHNIGQPLPPLKKYESLVLGFTLCRQCRHGTQTMGAEVLSPPISNGIDPREDFPWQSPRQHARRLVDYSTISSDDSDGRGPLYFPDESPVLPIGHQGITPDRYSVHQHGPHAPEEAACSFPRAP